MTKRDYKNEPYPICARFVHGELDLKTAFWGYLVGGTFVWSFACGISSQIPFSAFLKHSYEADYQSESSVQYLNRKT